MTEQIIVMVDEPRDYPHAKIKCFRKGACHLTVNGETAEHMKALHALAEKIGMRRSWFQDHKLAPHYDLTLGRRRAALAGGAVFVPAMDQARARIDRRNARTDQDIRLVRVKLDG